MHVVAECGNSSDPDGHIAEKRFTVHGPQGDFEVNENNNMTYEFDAEVAGLYETTLYIEDNEGASNQWNGTVVADEHQETEVTEPFNVGLVVTPDTGMSPLDVHIDGTSSTGTITEYSWSITGPDGYQYVETGIRGPPGTLDLTFENAGTYTIRLHIFGTEGSDMVSYTVHVEDLIDPVHTTNTPPVVDCDVEHELIAPAETEIDCSQSYDDVKIDNYRMTLTKYINGTQVDEIVEAAKESTIPVFTYTLEPGTYVVVMNVVDDEGLETKWNHEFSIDNNSSDETDDDSGDNTGDGSDNGTDEGTGDGNGDENGDGNGTGDGNDDGTDNETGNDGNQAPVPVLTINPSMGEAPLNVTISGDQSYDPDGNITSHSWIINGPEFQHVDLAVEGMPQTLNLEWTTEGDYTVQLIVMDNDGAAMSIENVVQLTGNSTDDGTEDGTGDGSDNGTDNETGEENGNGTGDGSDNGTDNETGDGNGDSNNDNNDNNNNSGETPNIKHIDVKAIIFESARIEWETDIDADSKVCYGTKEDSLDDYENDNSEDTKHEIELENLDEKTKYYYEVKSCNGNECQTEGPSSFTTLPKNPNIEDPNSEKNQEDPNNDWSNLKLSTDDSLQNAN